MFKGGSAALRTMLKGLAAFGCVKLTSRKGLLDPPAVAAAIRLRHNQTGIVVGKMKTSIDKSQSKLSVFIRPNTKSKVTGQRQAGVGRRRSGTNFGSSVFNVQIALFT
jgi:hypothetical protein